MPAPPLSVVLITLNAAGQLEPCLRSVGFAQEILVVDSGSTDATREIALKYGARVISQEWLGFGPQKRLAVEMASYDWVLCVDADERVTDALRASILGALENPAATAYRMARRNRFMGRYLHHGEGYPDWNLRLFDRRHANWSTDMVHEKVVADAPPADLRGDLLHDSAEDIAAYLDKQNRYTSLQAENMYHEGRRAHLGHLILSPALRFVRFYILKLGFLDGIPGLVHIGIGCGGSFIKYAKLMALQRGK